jgi:hypothetical protein
MIARSRNLQLQLLQQSGQNNTVWTEHSMDGVSGPALRRVSSLKQSSSECGLSNHAPLPVPGLDTFTCHTGMTLEHVYGDMALVH